MEKELNKHICNETIFSKLYEKYAQELTNYLYYKYGEHLNPSDKAQDALVKLWENCKKVSPVSAKSYLYKIANNMMYNESKHFKVVLNYQKIKPKDYTNESPEFLMEKEEFLVKYKEALENLPEEQRTAFLLNKAEGKRHAEIAELLGVTKKVVEYRIYTAFKALKSNLDGFSIK